MENNNVAARTWTNIMETLEKRTVEEVIEKSPKKKDNKEKRKTEQKKKHICITLTESKKPEPEVRKEENIKKSIGFCKKQNQEFFLPRHDRACNQTGKYNR